ncbi:MAG: hypothetical protein OEZ54_12195, partial [Gemmatimonadota bacterium]|nr:hypothetical protein [Gemmatimonadota bacterium]
AGAIEVETDYGESGRLEFKASLGGAGSWFENRYQLNQAELAGLNDGVDPFTPVMRYDVQDSVLGAGGFAGLRVAARGGVGSLNFAASSRFEEDNGIAANEIQRRFGARVHAGYSLNERLSIGVNASLTRGFTGFLQGGNTSPLFLVLLNPTSHSLLRDSITGIYPQGYFAVRHNPLARLALEAQEQWTDRAFGSIYASLAVLDNVDLYLRGDFDWVDDEISQLRVDETGSLIWADSTEVFLKRQALTAGGEHRLVVGGDWTFLTSIRFRFTRERGFASNWRTGSDATVSDETSNVTPLRHRIHWAPSESIRFRDRVQLDFGIARDESGKVLGPGAVGLEFSPIYSQWFPWVDVMAVVKPEVLVAYAGFQGSSNRKASGDPDLVVRPEQQTSTHFGLEATLFDGRFATTWTAYTRRTSGLIFTVDRIILGYAVPSLESAGVLRSEGMSWSMTAVLAALEGFEWRTGLHAALQRSEVENVFVSPTEADPSVYRGWPIGVFAGSGYARDQDGNPIYVDSVTPLYRVDTLSTGGLVTRFAFGDPIPNTIVSWSNTVRIGQGLKLGSMIEGQFGHQVVNWARAWGDWAGSTKVVEAEIDGRVPLGTYARNLMRRDLLEEFSENAGFVKLRYLSASYRLPETIANGLGPGTAIVVKAVARNILTLTNYTGLDPEAAMYGSFRPFSGQDFAEIPIPRSVAVSVGVSF